jgi:hypothetical protein
MNKKLIVVIVFLLVCSGFIGVSYSQDTGNAGNLLFTKVHTSDNERIWDVATVSADILDGGEYINVTILNVYPLYEAYIFFNITNSYDFPVEITSIPEAYDTITLFITSDLVVGTTIPAGETIAGFLAVEILQGALQDHPYSFRLDFNFEESV